MTRNPLEVIADFLHREMGFEKTAPFLYALGQAITRRGEALGGLTPELYKPVFLGSEEERAHLVDLLVVPETFFFRYPQSFLALAEWARERAARPLRILSFPCSTGEEAYSIAIQLRDIGLTQDAFHVEGRDLSCSALARARDGVYAANSFRTDNGSLRDRHFQPVPEGWRIKDSVREGVSFRQGNLLQLEDQKAWDAIFCRNVLIYFSVANQRTVASRLAEALVDDGLLFLGPAEPVSFLERGWVSAGFPMSFACRKGSLAAVSSSPRPRLARPVLPRARSPRPSSSPKPARTMETPDDLSQARRLADAGRLEEARALLLTRLDRRPQDPDGQLLLGVIEEARGALREAETCYRKVLFLEPQHTEALQHMALLLRRQGRLKAADDLARRAFRHGKNE